MSTGVNASKYLETVLGAFSSIRPTKFLKIEFPKCTCFEQTMATAQNLYLETVFVVVVFNPIFTLNTVHY